MKAKSKLSALPSSSRSCSASRAGPMRSSICAQYTLNMLVNWVKAKYLKVELCQRSAQPKSAICFVQQRRQPSKADSHAVHEQADCTVAREALWEVHLVTDPCCGPESSRKLHAVLILLTCHKAAVLWQRLHKSGTAGVMLCASSGCLHHPLSMMKNALFRTDVQHCCVSVQYCETGLWSPPWLRQGRSSL